MASDVFSAYQFSSINKPIHFCVFLTLEDMDSIWLYQEEAEDLKQKLQSMRLELEAARQQVSAAKEDNREKEKQLHNLLQQACKERDEAREQLHNLLSIIYPAVQPCLEIIPSPSSDESNKFRKQPMPQYPIANSSITESNTLSDPFINNINAVSSPVDSIFDAVTSPEFSTLNKVGENGTNVGFVNQKRFVQSMSQTDPIMSVYDYDHATAVIEGLLKGKILPQKGKLLEAVMEAGPLLQTLMLAGPLPRWRNPPHFQPFKIPQVAAMYGYPIADFVTRQTWSNNTNTPFAEMSCGSNSHIATNSMLNFSNGGRSNPSMIPPAMTVMNMNNQIAVGKRQRLM